MGFGGRQGGVFEGAECFFDLVGPMLLECFAGGGEEGEAVVGLLLEDAILWIEPRLDDGAFGAGLTDEVECDYVGGGGGVGVSGIVAGFDADLEGFAACDAEAVITEGAVGVSQEEVFIGGVGGDEVFEEECEGPGQIDAGVDFEGDAGAEGVGLGSFEVVDSEAVGGGGADFVEDRDGVVVEGVSPVESFEALRGEASYGAGDGEGAGGEVFGGELVGGGFCPALHASEVVSGIGVGEPCGDVEVESILVVFYGELGVEVVEPDVFSITLDAEPAIGGESRLEGTEVEVCEECGGAVASLSLSEGEFAGVEDGEILDQ